MAGYFEAIVWYANSHYSEIIFAALLGSVESEERSALARFFNPLRRPRGSSVLLLTNRREEQLLLDVFGADSRRYKRHTIFTVMPIQTTKSTPRR